MFGDVTGGARQERQDGLGERRPEGARHPVKREKNGRLTAESVRQLAAIDLQLPRSAAGVGHTISRERHGTALRAGVPRPREVEHDEPVLEHHVAGDARGAGTVRKIAGLNEESALQSRCKTPAC